MRKSVRDKDQWEGLNGYRNKLRVSDAKHHGDAFGWLKQRGKKSGTENTFLG